LYAFVDTGYLSGREPVDVARQLCDGGADLIQLRAKGATAAEIVTMAHSILPVTRAAGVDLVINDYAALAAEVGAEYCHLGQEDFFGADFTSVSEVREDAFSGNPVLRAGTDRDLRDKKNRLGIGLSTHAPEQAQRATAAGADYIAIGPVYATGTKPGVKPVTLQYVRWAAENVRIPWFAIGGINLDNLDDVLAAGARRICVVSAILQSQDIAAACRRFKERLELRSS
jgi:thiamine-phosphate pyrophosphorylase